MQSIPIQMEKLWQKYYTTRDSEIKKELIENYIPLVKHVVYRMNINLPTYLEQDDLISYGIFGLIQAIERYDVKKSIKFETYAYSRIRGSIIDELRKLDLIPQNIRRKVQLLQNTYSQLEQGQGGSVSDEDVCKELNISLSELYSLYKKVTPFTNLIPFDDFILTENKKFQKPEKSLEQKEVKRLLGNAINGLPKREKLVITLYYYEGLNFKEISKVLNLSQGRISQLHTKAILRLRGKLSKKKANLI